MGGININKNNIVIFCDKIIEIFIYALIFCLPFSKAAVEISAGFIIIAWIVKRAFSSGAAWRFKPVSTYLNIPIIIYILANFLSVIFSSRFILSLKNFGTKTMEYIMLYFIVCEFVADRRRLKNTVIFMLVSAAMISVDCIFQYFFGFDFLRLREMEAQRITASFQMPGDLAGYLGPLLCLSLSLCFLKFRKEIKYFLRIESILLLGLLIATLARGAWIGFIVALFFLSIIENRKILYFTIAFLFISGVIASQFIKIPGDILGYLKSIFMLSADANLYRKEIWQAALGMIRDRPLFGHGLTTFMSVYPKYGKDYYFLNLGLIPYAHNCYLQIAAETGIVGLITFLWLIGKFFFYSIASLKKRIKDKFYHAVLSGISAGIIVTLVHSAVDTNLYSLQLSVLFWVMLGLNAALQRNSLFKKAED